MIEWTKGMKLNAYEKAHARHVLLCVDGCCCFSAFVLLLFQSKLFFVETETHTPSRMYVNWKNQSAPHFTEKKQSKNYFMFTHKKLLLVRLSVPFQLFNGAKTKMHTHKHTHRVHVNINKAFNAIAVVQCVNGGQGWGRIGALLCISTCSPHFRFFLSIFSCLQLFCACVIYRAFKVRFSSLLLGAVLLAVNSKWQQQQMPSSSI